MREVSGLLESESYGPASSLASGPGSSLAHAPLGGGTATVSSGRQWILARIATRTMAPLAAASTGGPSSAMQGGRLFPASQVDVRASFCCLRCCLEGELARQLGDVVFVCAPCHLRVV